MKISFKKIIASTVLCALLTTPLLVSAESNLQTGKSFNVTPKDMSGWTEKFFFLDTPGANTFYSSYVNINDLLMPNNSMIGLAYRVNPGANAGNINGECVAVKYNSGTYQIGTCKIASGHFKDFSALPNMTLSSAPKKLGVNVKGDIAYIYVTYSEGGKNTTFGKTVNIENNSRDAVALASTSNVKFKNADLVTGGSITDGNYMAVQGDGSIFDRCVAYTKADGQWKQIFRTNGTGESGTLCDLIVEKDQAYIVSYMNRNGNDYVIVGDGGSNNYTWKVVGGMEEYNRDKAITTINSSLGN